MTEPTQDAAPAGISSVIELIGKGAPGGVCDLDSAGVVPISRIPLTLGGTGGLVASTTQTISHSLAGGSGGGLESTYPVWVKASDFNYYVDSTHAYRTTSASTIVANYYRHSTACAASQWAQATVTGMDGERALQGLILRSGSATSAGSRDGLIVLWWTTDAYESRVSIGRFLSRDQIAWMREAPCATISDGSVLRASVAGDTVTAYVDGTEVLAATSSALGGALGSYPGIYLANGGGFSDFRAGSTTTPMRVNQPLAVHLTSNYTNPSGSDMIAGGNWAQVIGPDDVFRSGGETGLGGNTAYARCVIPTNGWYRCELWVSSGATTGTAACKIMRRTGTAAPTVTSDSIASNLGNAGGEGTPLFAATVELMQAGDVVYWSSWASVSSVIKTANFGAVKTRFMLTRIA